MEVYTVSFFGHREVSDVNEVESRLEFLIRELVCSQEYVEFLVSRGGEFDSLVSSLIRRIMKENDYGNAAHTLVLPYMTEEYKHNVDNFMAFYTDVEICEKSSLAHFKSAYRIRNQYVIDRSDLVVGYVQHNSGGAFTALQYAGRAGKLVYNLGAF